jgi:hypothetical protein
MPKASGIAGAGGGRRIPIEKSSLLLFAEVMAQRHVGRRIQQAGAVDEANVPLEPKAPGLNRHST